MITLAALRATQRIPYSPTLRLTVFDEQRRTLVQQLRTKGIRDERVLSVMNSIKREDFVHKAFTQGAYADSALPIGCRQTISQPYTVAYMTSLLDAQSEEKILEIGTGSGYQAAVLALLGASVYTIERFEELYRSAALLFEKMNLSINVRCADGTLGWQEQAPFDGIIVTAGSPDIPPSLLSQLAIGGRLIIPIGTQQSQTLYRIVRTSVDNYDVKEYKNFRFVPLVGCEGWQSE